MPIRIGDSSIEGIYIGDDFIKEVYLGDNLIYKFEYVPPEEVPDPPEIEEVIDPTYNYYIFDTSKVSGTNINLQAYGDNNIGDFTYDYGTTDWGDGKLGGSIHAYENDGIYTVKTRYRLGNCGTEGNNVNTRKMLIGCKCLNNDMDEYASHFAYCTNLREVDLTKCDMSKVMTLYGMFYGCTSLVSVNLSGLNIGKLGYAPNYSTTPPYWYENQLKGTARMFYGCTSLESVDLSGWNISVNFDASYMFYNCPSLKTINLSDCSDETINLFVPQLPARSDNQGVIYVSEIKSSYPSVSGWSYELAS